MADVNKVIPFIEKWEGGYQAMKEDTGNYLNGKLIGTNKGVTPAAYQQTFGKAPTVQDMKNLTKEQFTQVLKKFYWNRWKADKIENQSVANILVDWVWASGKWGVIKPQQLLGVEADGIVGDKTVCAVNAQDQKQFFNKIVEARIKFVEGIVKSNPNQAKFIKGWKSRINDFKFSE